MGRTSATAPVAAPASAGTPVSRAPALRRGAATVVMLASGFAGLGDQIVWTQQCALWLGHESAAVLAVVAAFFGGLALGALALGRRIERSARPLRWYAVCELVIAGWASLLVAVMAPVSQALLGLIGAQPHPAWQWTVAFVGCTALLLPATAAMGATLPAMERLLAAAARGGRGGRSIAGLYAANTAGAVAGVLATAFWLVPALGLSRTAGLCIALNLLCAALAGWALRGTPASATGADDGPAAGRSAWAWPTAAEVAAVLATAPGASAATLATATTPQAANARQVLRLLALTGLLGIAYELLVVRVLSQVAEDTVYTFALLLAVYLVGTALGAAAWQRWGRPAAGAADHSDDPGAQAQRLLVLLGAACTLGTASLWAAEHSLGAVRAALGPGMASAIAAEGALALLAFGLPTLVMGALFSRLCATASAAGLGFGTALGVNTLGAAVAPLLFGVLLVPLLGPKLCLLGVAGAYLGLGLTPTPALASRPGHRQPLAWATAAVLLGLGVAAPPLAFTSVPPGGQLLSYQEGAMAAVSVVQDADGVASLRINNRQQEGSSATGLVDGRQALLPLLLHPAPQRALFLGLGTGVTAATAASASGLQVDAVELLPEVIAASQRFVGPSGADSPNPRLNLIHSDARRFVRATTQRYDLVVADNFHPARSGSAALYTVAHFEAVRARLAPGGLFCQWLPLHQLDRATLRSIVQSFRAVYPGGWAVLASNSLATPVLGLIGQPDGTRLDPARVRQRLAQSGLPRPPAAYGLDDEWALLGSAVAGPQALAQLAGDAPLNTDDHPVVAHLAPRATYAPELSPGDQLVALLPQLAIAPATLIDAQAQPEAARRLAAYWGARQQFIVAGQGVVPTADLRQMLAQVRAPLLAVLARSPDFRPAYDPLLQMATALARQDVPAAQALLGELARLQPARPEAAQQLQALAAR